jgi:hypothetical protein
MLPRIVSKIIIGEIEDTSFGNQAIVISMLFTVLTNTAPQSIPTLDL